MVANLTDARRVRLLAGADSVRTAQEGRTHMQADHLQAHTCRRYRLFGYARPTRNEIHEAHEDADSHQTGAGLGLGNGHHRKLVWARHTHIHGMLH